MATNIKVNVLDSALVNHGGVPISYDEALTSLAGLRLIDAAGAPIPFILTPNSRWDDVPSGGGRVRHALLTALPAATGTHYLTDVGGATALLPAFSANDGVNLVLTNSRGTAVLPKSGFDLFSSLTIDGASVLNGAQVVLKASVAGTPYMLKLSSGSIVEQDAMHAVTRQIGVLDDGAGGNPSLRLSFEVWNYWYANTPCIRTQIRVLNRELSGSAYFASPTTPVNFDYLRLEVGTMNPTTASTDTITNNIAAINRVKTFKVGSEVKRTFSTATFGAHNLTVIESAEKFPFVLDAAVNLVRYHIFPTAMQFHEDFVASWSITLGKDTVAHSRMLTDAQFFVDPVYAMDSKVYSPFDVARFNWTASDAEGSAEQAEVYNRTEQFLGIPYNVNDSFLALGPDNASGRVHMSMYEQAESPVDQGMMGFGANDYGQWFGWDTYGNDKQPAGGYTHGVYDMQEHFWMQFFRTGSQRAYRLASSTTRYHADQGTVPSWIDYGGNFTLGRLGNNKYEQVMVIGAPGSTDEQLTHSWGHDLKIAKKFGLPFTAEPDAQHTDNAFRVNYQWNGGTNLATSLDGSFDYGVGPARGWPQLELLQAWKWDGNIASLNRAVQYMETYRQAEVFQGSNGYYNRNVLLSPERVSPFILGGYLSRGFFEVTLELRRRGTPSALLEALLVRVADWIRIGDNGFKVLEGGVTVPGVSRTPLVAWYFFDGLVDWVADGKAIQFAIQLNSMVNAAYQLTGRADLRILRDEMWKDLAFYLWSDGSPQPITWPIAFRGDITMRNRVDYGTTNKVAGQIAAHLAYHLGVALRDSSQPTPVNSSIGPTSGPVATAVTLTIAGSSFVQGAVVSFGGYRVTPTTVSATSITVTIPAHLVVTGAIPVIVINPNGEASASQIYNIVINPLPAVTTISPNTAAAGSATLNPLVITGTGFIPASVVKWNGITLTSMYISATTINAEVPAALLTTAGAANVTVTNPLPGGGVSNAAVFTITAAPNPVPTFTSMSPNTATAGSPNLPVTFTGTNFVPGAQVFFGATPLTTTFVNATTVTATVPSTLLTTAGTTTVNIVNPTPGGGTSNNQTFTITAAPNPAPVITLLTPSSVVAGSGGLLLSVMGSNFTPLTMILVNGLSLPVTFVSASNVTVNIPASFTGAVGNLNVQAANGNQVSNFLTLRVRPFIAPGAGVGYPYEDVFDVQPLPFNCPQPHQTLNVREDLQAMLVAQEVIVKAQLDDFHAVIATRPLQVPNPEDFHCYDQTVDPGPWSNQTGAVRND